ncbi:nucleotidyltransferase [filamentous cyanobacterium CCT1]|nr:nucleotidyltransferase [filamentous cyanobacterium CCT1]PSN80003.1 nucleotidyltransferase [filamentous cyanobacterium CCP4]
MNLEERLKVERASILNLANKYGAYNVRIFGSVARGEADSNSDVDFLVAMESGRSLLDLGGLLMELQELLDCSVDIVTDKGLRTKIRERVLAEAVPL